jgi:uncharacterized protein YyaL (SSP411 family)
MRIGIAISRWAGWTTLAAPLLALAAAGPADAADTGEPLPGAPPISEALSERIAAELATRGAGYVPRTRNLNADGSARFSNRLLLETSPYLQQHAHNPVNWYPWGDEAFEAAARLGRPVLLSIGYSTCHWCHVMEAESFDDPELARYLNAHFIAIKVDREARPDIDAVYMAAVHAMNRRGGWPLNVWLTPDRKPFFAGTYFPPEDRDGLLGFRTVLRNIHERYTQDPGAIAEVSGEIAVQIVQRLGDVAATSSAIPDEGALAEARSRYRANIDPRWGGIGRATKFPSTVPARLLLRLDRRTPDAETRRLVELTLTRMAAGGIRDQIGGGFHRYSTEPRWLVPHFEKMLYDNALLAGIYVEAHRATGRGDFAEIARDTLQYLLREMGAPEGGFYSATDADSIAPAGEAEEGRFFTWTPGEIQSVLGAADAELVSAFFGVGATGHLDGRSILHTWRSPEEVATALGATPAVVRRTVAIARERLYAARARRPAPLRDDKILAAWNGLAISAFAQAGFSFGNPDHTRTAARAAAFVLDEMRRDGRLLRVYKNERADGPAFLEDYAFLVAGLLDLYEADPNPRWLREAVALQAVLDEHYLDREGGGYFKTADDQEQLLAREKPNADGAVPSGNSVAAMNLLRLAQFTSDDRYRNNAARLFSAFHPLLTRQPTRLPEMLLALEYFLGATKQVILVRPASGEGAEEMLSTLRAAYVPNRIVVVATEGADLARHAAIVRLLTGKRAENGLTTAYVCEERLCKLPTADPATFAAQLRQRSRRAAE